MANRIRFVQHKGKEILVVDFSDASEREVERIARMVPDHVTSKPLRSVLLVADFTGASFDRDSLASIKEAAVFDKPHVLKSAWVGAESLPHFFLNSVKSFSRREFPTFATQADAMDWLVED